MSHLMDNTGKQIDAELAYNYMTKLGSVFSHSMVAKRKFRELTGRNFPRHVSHRWGSLEEVMAFVMEENHTIGRFIRSFCNSDGRRNKTGQQLQVIFCGAELGFRVGRQHIAACCQYVGG
ncbi:unnamed protein product [Laminaria digitata]